MSKVVFMFSTIGDIFSKYYSPEERSIRILADTVYTMISDSSDSPSWNKQTYQLDKLNDCNDFLNIGTVVVDGICVKRPNVSSAIRVTKRCKGCHIAVNRHKSTIYKINRADTAFSEACTGYSFIRNVSIRQSIELDIDHPNTGSTYSRNMDTLTGFICVYLDMMMYKYSSDSTDRIKDIVTSSLLNLKDDSERFNRSGILSCMGIITSLYVDLKSCDVPDINIIDSVRNYIVGTIHRNMYVELMDAILILSMRKLIQYKEYTK